MHRLHNVHLIEQDNVVTVIEIPDSANVTDKYELAEYLNTDEAEGGLTKNQIENIVYVNETPDGPGTLNLLLLLTLILDSQTVNSITVDWTDPDPATQRYTLFYTPRYGGAITAVEIAEPMMAAKGMKTPVAIRAIVTIVPIYFLMLFQSFLNQPWPEGSVNFNGLFLT